MLVPGTEKPEIPDSNSVDEAAVEPIDIGTIRPAVDYCGMVVVGIEAEVLASDPDS